MRISVRKSGEVIIGMGELEAVTLQEVIAKTYESSEANPNAFTRSQKAVLKDAYKNLNDLDKAIGDMEKRTADPEEIDASSEYPNELVNASAEAEPAKA